MRKPTTPVLYRQRALLRALYRESHLWQAVPRHYRHSGQPAITRSTTDTTYCIEGPQLTTTTVFRLALLYEYVGKLHANISLQCLFSLAGRLKFRATKRRVAPQHLSLRRATYNCWIRTLDAFLRFPSSLHVRVCTYIPGYQVHPAQKESDRFFFFSLVVL